MGKDNTAIGINGENSSALKLGSTKSNLISENPPNENVKEISSCPSSLDLSSDVGRPVDADGHISLSSYPDELVIHSAPSSSSSVEGAEEESNTSMRRIDYEDSGQKVERFSDATADSKGSAQYLTMYSIFNTFSSKPVHTFFMYLFLLCCCCLTRRIVFYFRN